MTLIFTQAAGEGLMCSQETPSRDVVASVVAQGAALHSRHSLRVTDHRSSREAVAQATALWVKIRS